MATLEAGAASAPSARVVGNAFVEQYYHILHQSPGLVHRFYQDSSLLSRPDAGGEMTTVTTTQILSLNYKDYTAEIKAADAQESYGRGVIVLVTGCLTGKDNVRRNFTQTFFLAPQEKGYFILNDVFRYPEEDGSHPVNSIPSNNICDNVPSPALALEPGPEPTDAPDQQAVELTTSFEEDDLVNGHEVCDASGNEAAIIAVEAVESQIQSLDMAPVNEEDAPKKSYASIVKVMQGSSVALGVCTPSTIAKVAVAKDNQQLPEKPSASMPSGSSSDAVPESSNAPEAGRSIYVRKLPFDATAEQLEEVFKKFGPIKHEGIQVRSNKGSCFGFVEFENQSSMQSALETSLIMIGNHQAAVEEKRTNNRVVSGGRGRFPMGRGGFRNENFRGRGGFGGGRGYGRNEFRSQGEFPPCPGAPMGQDGEGYYRGAYQNGSGGGSRGVVETVGLFRLEVINNRRIFVAGKQF